MAGLGLSFKLSVVSESFNTVESTKVVVSESARVISWLYRIEEIKNIMVKVFFI